jgi:hypothetical protein
LLEEGPIPRDIALRFFDDGIDGGWAHEAVRRFREPARHLTGVGSIVQDFQLSTSGGVEMIRHTATGIRSNAVQTTLLANQLSELAGRLDTVASF